MGTATIHNITAVYPQGYTFTAAAPVNTAEAGTAEKYSYELGTSLSGTLRDLANDHETGLFVIFCAALGMLLRRYSWEETVVVNIPFTGAGNGPVQVPLVLTGSAGSSMRECMEQARQSMMDSYRYTGEWSLLPASNITVTLEGAYGAAGPLTGMHVCIVRDGNAGFRLDIHYLPSVFSAAFVSRMAGHLGILLRNVPVPSVKAGAVNLLTAEEESWLQQQSTTKAFPQNISIPGVFEAQVKSAPAHTALLFENRCLTYEELSQAVVRLASQIRELHAIQENDIIGIYLPKSEEWIVAMLAAMSCGAAFLPLDPANPAMRTAHMIQDAGVKLLITHTELLLKMPAGDTPVLAVDMQAGVAAVAALPAVSNAALAYVIYTSGSTGVPRGVMVTHRQCLNTVFDHIDRFHITADDRILQFAAMSFDVAVCEILIALLSGATLVLPPERLVSEPDSLAAFMEEKKVSLAMFTPSYYKFYKPAQLKTLRAVITGGEMPSPNDILRSLPYFEYYNAYGPTECAICAAVYKADNSITAGRPVPIGRPLANTAIYLLDPQGKQVPVGCKGEICIAGEGTAAGYLAQPGLTAAQFTADPFRAGRRMYKTGDLGYMQEDGNIVFLGREDSQVKLNGMRISLEEINRVITAHPAVKAAYAYMKQPADAGSRLACAVLPDAEAAYTVNKLLKFRQEQPDLFNKRYHLPNGLTLFTVNNNEAALLYNEIFEEQLYFRHGIQLQPGDVVIDAGANIGMFSLFVTHACKGLQVYAFEPIPDVYDMLAANAQLYEQQIRTFNCGLSDEDSTVVFHYYPNNTALSGMYTDSSKEMLVRNSITASSAAEGITLAAAQLDLLVKEKTYSYQVQCPVKKLSTIMKEQGLQEIALLKIDVEHNESRILNAIEDEDWSKIRQIVMELHGNEAERRQMKDMLAGKGFCVQEVYPEDMDAIPLTMIYCVREKNVQHSTGAQLPLTGRYITDAAQLAAELRKHAAAYLSPVFIPADLYFISQLPLTANGKIDQEQLRVLENEWTQEAGITPPRNETEAALLELWQEVLQIREIGVTDNFFDKGGNSLRVIRLLDLLQKQYPGLLSASDLFDMPTIGQQAALINMKHTGHSRESAAAPEVFTL